MDDLDKYIQKRKKLSKEFEENFDKGYDDFKIGELLKLARTEAGFTQEEVAIKLNTKKSAISRIENHALDIKLSTLQNFANILGKELKIELIWFKKEKNPNIPWAKTKDFRNIIAHNYFGIDSDEIWEIITKKIKPLKYDIFLLLKEL